MERALDATILELGSLGDRDKILDRFFEHAAALFQFSVLFVVRGEMAHGHNVQGLGAPIGLVTRLALSLKEPGLLAQARAEGRVFIAAKPSEEADLKLFGSLGRAMPQPLVLPLSVRQRVVGIFIGDGVSEPIAKRAEQIGRPAIEIVKDDLMILAESVSDVLERLIRRRKNSSRPPPPADLAMTPPPAIARPPRTGFELPATVTPPVIIQNAFAAPAPLSLGRSEPAAVPRPATSPSRRRFWFAAVGSLSALVAVGIGWWLLRGESRSERVVAAGTSLKGWPNQVDPAQVLAQAEKALSQKADLGGIDAEVTSAGLVDFGGQPKNTEGIFLRYVFLNDDVQGEVLVDNVGVHPARQAPRERCGDAPCRGVAGPPQCSFAKIVERARHVGLDEADRPLVKYGAAAGDRAGMGPEWLVLVAGRGSVRFDGQSCSPLPRERLRPPALPLAKIPSAPREIDPLEIVPLARTQSGLEADATLLELETRGVGENGKIDISVPDSEITYVFAEPLGQRLRRWRTVFVRRDGMPIAGDEGDATPVPIRLSGLPVRPPQCALKQARDILMRGLPQGSLARVTFGPDPSSAPAGQWTLEIPNLPSRRTIGDLDCEAMVRLQSRPRR